MATALLQSIDFKLHERPAPELLTAGVVAFDIALGGVPRGSVTDIFGPASSGRTTLALALLSAATVREESCALVDASDAFDPASAAAAGVVLDRLLWIRCGGNAEHALKVTDLLLQAGGFGLVVMDLGDIAPQTARRISLASWYRLRRAIENTPTALVVVERAPHARACATLALECARNRIKWSGAPGCSELLRGASFSAERRKPLRPAGAIFEAHALDSAPLRSRLGKNVEMNKAAATFSQLPR
jgi:RecA DNA recombination protein